MDNFASASFMGITFLVQSYIFQNMFYEKHKVLVPFEFFLLKDIFRKHMDFS
jgi:hypothetical protein